MDLENRIYNDKLKGLSDQEIGENYNVSLKQIEKIVLKKEGINVSKLEKNKLIKNFFPKNFTLEQSTIWSFKSRGNWATHNGNYRGNWSPYIPRNVILRYSRENDLVLDYFCGSGTTAIECKLLNRNFIGVDINEKAIELAKQNVNFDFLFSNSKIEFYVGDSRDLSFIKDSTIDLICSHPPYANIINYTHNNSADLSHLESQDFLTEIYKVAKESYRVLKDGKICAILIGDMRKNKFIIPLGFWTIEKYLEAGFQLKELVIKRQHNCKTTGFWYNNSLKYNFLLLAHEYLAIFQKTDSKENIPQKKELTSFDFKIIDDLNFETTTVWIFKSDGYFDLLISNLIKRYSQSYSIYNFDSNKINELTVYFVSYDFEEFIKNLNKAKKGTTVAIVCEDVRLKNKLIFSEALFIEQKLRNVSWLKLKEIIVVALERDKRIPIVEDLEIKHKYVFIYNKIE